MAGVVTMALLAWLAVPISETSLGHRATASIAKSDQLAHVRIAEAGSPGVAQEGGANSSSPYAANPPDAKVGTPRMCEGADGACGQAKAVAPGDKLAKIAAAEKSVANDDEGKGAPATAEKSERPRPITMARGEGPASVG